MGVAKKPLSPSIQARTVVKGVSRTLIEYIRSGIRFITILPIFRHHFHSLYVKLKLTPGANVEILLVAVEP